MTRGVQASHLKRTNERAVLDSLRATSPATVPEIAGRVGLSKPTVASALRTLQTAGLVQERGFRFGRSGQAPVLWGINDDAGVVLGVDIGTQWVRLVLGDLAGHTLGTHRSRPGSGSAQSILRTLDHSIGHLLAETGRAPESIVFTVVGSPGVLDPASNRVEHASNLPGWGDPSTLGALRAQFGDRFVVMKDVYLAALGEVQARGQAAPDFVLMSVGRGVGAAVVHDGQPLPGTHGLAGEVAFLPIGVPAAGQGSRSVRGSLEDAGSADALLNAASSDGSVFTTVADVFVAAAAGDPAATAAVGRESRVIAYALAALIIITDPPLVVLAGSVGLHGAERFASQVRRDLADLLPFEAPSVEISVAGENASLDGALGMGLDLGWSALVEAL